MVPLTEVKLILGVRFVYHTLRKIINHKKYITPILLIRLSWWRLTLEVVEDDMACSQIRADMFPSQLGLTLEQHKSDSWRVVIIQVQGSVYNLTLIGGHRFVNKNVNVWAQAWDPCSWRVRRGCAKERDEHAYSLDQKRRVLSRLSNYNQLLVVD